MMLIVGESRGGECANLDIVVRHGRKNELPDGEAVRQFQGWIGATYCRLKARSCVGVVVQLLPEPRMTQLCGPPQLTLYQSLGLGGP